MAKKVYKTLNKLQREELEKKEARRKAMEGNKSAPKEDRMEKMYKEMLEMSDSDFEKRKQEIAIRLQEIEKERAGRTRDGKELSADIAERLMREEAKLKKEQKRLESFPKVKEQIKKIIVMRDRIKKQKEANFEKAKSDLKNAQKEYRDEKNRVENIKKELNSIKKLSSEISKKETLSQDDKKQLDENTIKYNQLLKEYNKENRIEELKKNVETAKAKVNLYKSGKSTEDGMINKCNMAWKMLLAGRSWDEISIVSIKDVQERQAEAKGKENNQSYQSEQGEKAEEPKQNSLYAQTEVDLGQTQAMVGEYVNNIVPESRSEIESEPESEMEQQEEQQLIPTEKIGFFQRIKNRFSAWRENRRRAKQNMQESEIAETPENEQNPNNSQSQQKGEKPENIQGQQESVNTKRDEFMEYLKKYAEKEGTGGQKFRRIKGRGRNKKFI